MIFYHRGLGDIALASGDYAQAYSQFEESFEHAINLNFVWGAVYSQAGIGRAAVTLKNFDAATKYLSQGLLAVITTRDDGLALVVLAACAEFCADHGEIDQAFELCCLVTGHFAAWRETKTQAAVLLNRVKAQSPDHFSAVNKREHRDEIWDMTNCLLEKDFKPD